MSYIDCRCVCVCVCGRLLSCAYFTCLNILEGSCSNLADNRYKNSSIPVIQAAHSSVEINRPPLTEDAPSYATFVLFRYTSGGICRSEDRTLVVRDVTTPLLQLLRSELGCQLTGSCATSCCCCCCCVASLLANMLLERSATADGCMLWGLTMHSRILPGRTMSRHQSVAFAYVRLTCEMNEQNELDISRLLAHHRSHQADSSSSYLYVEFY